MKTCFERASAVVCVKCVCSLQPPSTQFALDTARGMQFAHEQGVLHRDLKSMNLLVHKDASGEFIVKVRGLDTKSSGIGIGNGLG